MKISFYLILIFLSFSLYSQSGKVIKIKDGDTVVILDSYNNQITLRLAEVDCPESKQNFGKKAKEFTSNEVGSKIVNYKIIDTDRFGRSIAEVYYNNKYLSEEIIKNGYGWHYKRYSQSKKLSQFELLAKKNKLGIWADKNIVAPWDFRKLNK